MHLKTSAKIITVAQNDFCMEIAKAFRQTFNQTMVKLVVLLLLTFTIVCL